MSEQSIRGQEVTLKVSVNGQTGDGSWLKVTDWTVTERKDVAEKDYIGESTTSVMYQHHGWDIAFNVDIEDARIAEFVDTIVANDEAHVAHPVVTITAIVQPRKNGEKAWAWCYQNVVLAIDSEQAKGRKEVVMVALSGKCRKRKRVTI